MGTSWFNNFSFRYLSRSIFPVFQLLSPELFAVLDCTVPHRDLSPTRAIGLVSDSVKKMKSVKCKVSTALEASFVGRKMETG